MEPVSVAQRDKGEFHEIRTACFGRIFVNRRMESNDVEPTHVPNDWPKSICEMPVFACNISTEPNDSLVQSLVEQMQELVPQLKQQKEEIDSLRKTVADQAGKMEQLDSKLKYIQKLVMSHQSRILEQSVAQFAVVEAKMFPASLCLNLCRPSTSSGTTKKISTEAYLVPSWSDEQTPPTVILGRDFGERYISEINIDKSNDQGMIVIDVQAASIPKQNYVVKSTSAQVFSKSAKRLLTNTTTTVLQPNLNYPIL